MRKSSRLWRNDADTRKPESVKLTSSRRLCKDPQNNQGHTCAGSNSWRRSRFPSYRTRKRESGFYQNPCGGCTMPVHFMLHISRSDALTVPRCCRRRIGEYASDACPARPVSRRDTIHIGRRARALSADLDQELS